MKNCVTRVPGYKTTKPQKRKIGPYVELGIDRNFKFFFSSPKRKDLLLALLQVFLPELGIESVEPGPQEHIGKDSDLINSIFDVSCTTVDGRAIVIEAQYSTRPDYLDRMLYYSTWPIDEQIHTNESDNYTLNDVYVLSFINFALIHDKDWEQAEWDTRRNGAKVISSYSIREDSNGEKMTDALHFRFVELKRFLKTEEELESIQDWWLYILKNAGSLNEELQIRLSEGGDILNRLLEAVRVEGMDKNEKNEYFKNMKNAFDIKSEKWFARQEGIEEGMAKGLKEGAAAEKEAIAKKLKERGINVDDIAAITSLSKETVISLSERN